MRLSTKGRFAVTAMIDVGLREKAGPVSLSDIALRHHISLSYLEQLFSRLRRHGLVESTRGPGGGYGLARQAEAINVADIIAAVESDSPDVESREDAHVEESDVAATTAALWSALNAKMVAHMQSISLRSLVDEQLAQGVKIEKPSKLRRGIYSQPKTESLRPDTPNSVFALGAALLSSR